MLLFLNNFWPITRTNCFFQIKVFFKLVTFLSFNLWFGVSPQAERRPHGLADGHLAELLEGWEDSSREPHITSLDPEVSLAHWHLHRLMPGDRAMETACFRCISKAITAPFPCNRTVLIMHISLCCIPQGLVSPNDVTLDYSSCIQLVPWSWNTPEHLDDKYMDLPGKTITTLRLF